MKLLTATRERQGERDGDFCFAVEGELVLLGFVCASDEADPDGGCGCGRAFSGMSSMRATTTALVRDLDLSTQDVRLAVEGYYVAAGMGPEIVGAAEFAELVSETLDEMNEIARALPVGAVVGRRLNRLIWRSEPSEVGEL
jgi:hypothetical protein